MSRGRVLVAMSGGVDSSVVASLLVEQGYECVGATMRLATNEDDRPGERTCCSTDDVADARQACWDAGIRHHVFDYTEAFERDVIDPFVAAYEAGLTPNPCVACNRHLKFGALLDRALKLGCGFLATGHYARVEHDGQGYHLLKGVDAGKDQSYFLFGLTQQRLAHVLFPLGGLHKDPEVRAIAERLGLTSAHKRDSEGICFVPSGNHLRFIEQRTGRAAPAGDILDTDGNVIGHHEGALRYTLGQRKGLGVACARPVYVCAIDTVANTVTRHLGEKQLITAEMVNNVKDSNNSMPGNDREILEVIPQDYQLGTQVVADPIGIASDVIEGHFLNIISNTSVSESVYNCFRSAHLNVVGMPITVLALADAILTEPEKRSGCAFVDMGAETTSVAIFKNNILRHFAVIPLGGANVNRDLCTLQIEDSEAEQLKRKYATAYSNEEEDKHEPVTLGDGRTVKYEEFNGLVEARMEEIILNIKHQIALSKYDDSKLVSGIVVTGGAANMKNIDKAFAAFTDFRKVRFVKNTRLQTRLEGKPSSSFNADGSFNAAIALIDKGEINCCGGVIGQEGNAFEQQAQGGNVQTENDFSQQGMQQTLAGTGQQGVQNVTIGGHQNAAQTQTVAQGQQNGQTTDAETEETSERETKKPKQKSGMFGRISSIFKKVTNAAGNLVNDDDDRFMASRKDKE